jgi:hypothetical protein
MDLVTRSVSVCCLFASLFNVLIFYTANCGDGYCNSTEKEDCITCPTDCTDVYCGICGDLQYNRSLGEDCSSCPEDCGFCGICPILFLEKLQKFIPSH